MHWVKRPAARSAGAGCNCLWLCILRSLRARADGVARAGAPAMQKIHAAAEASYQLHIGAPLDGHRGVVLG